MALHAGGLPRGEESMKNVTLALASILILAVSAPVFAQSQADEIELTREIIQTERKAIVAANMQLSEGESRGFWPVYNEYVTALRKVNDRRVKLITSYAAAYENLTDSQAKAFLKESMDIEMERMKLRENWVAKFGEVLSPKMVARFFQIENKIDAIINYELAAEIPLVRGK
jgi:hypothetical protein